MKKQLSNQSTKNTLTGVWGKVTLMLLLFLFWAIAGFSAFAQRSVPVAAQITYIDFATKTVTCDLSWTGRDDRHRDTVWLFVDFKKVQNNVPTGTWQPATLTPAATTVTAAAGNVYTALGSTTVTGNTRGVWIHGKAENNSQRFHTTVQLKLDAAATPAAFNACAKVKSKRPVILYTNSHRDKKNSCVLNHSVALGSLIYIAPRNKNKFCHI